VDLASDTVDGSLRAEQEAHPQRIAHRRLTRRRGGWFAIFYDQSFKSQPTRPLFRAYGNDGQVIEAIMPAAVFGHAEWIGYLPKAFVELEVLIFEATADDFRVSQAIELSLASLQPILLRRGLSHLWRFWSHDGWLSFGQQERWVRYLPDRYPLATVENFATKRGRKPELNGLDRIAVDDGVIVGFLLFVAEPVSALDLAATITSLRAQPLNNWNLALCVDAQSVAQVTTLVAEFADTRISVVEIPLPQSRTPVVADYFAAMNMRWIGFLEPGERLVAEAIIAILGDPSDAPSFLYTDSIATVESGQTTPDFAPDWSPEYLRREDYIRGLWLTTPDLAMSVMRELMLRHGNFREIVAKAALDGVDSVLVRHIRRPILLQGRERESRARKTMAPSQPTIIDPAPKVSIIVPTRDRLDLLRRAIDSVREKTSYRNYEIVIVDNASVDRSTVQYLNGLRGENIACVVAEGGDFNFSRLVNRGVAASTADMIVLLNNDTYVMEPNWLSELVGLAIRPGNGAIGAKLLYPNTRLQHAGVVLGMGGYAGHRFRHRRHDYSDYWGRLRHAHEVSAVTGACLAVTRRNFDRVGGFDETFATAFNDIDFCLRLRKVGLRNIWTPHAVLGHVESASRVGPRGRRSPRFRAEADRFADRWRTVFPNDPYFHPAFALGAFDEMLE
jgi:GT2 family glycosyltransferase